MQHKEFSPNDRNFIEQNSRGELSNSFFSNNTTNHLDALNHQVPEFDAKRKSFKNEEYEGSPINEMSECSMTYSVSNPTRTNTLSHRANSRQLNNKKVLQNNSKSIEFLRVRDLKNNEDGLINMSDVNESQYHELDSKREAVYMPLEIAKSQIKQFEDEMKSVTERHTRLISELENNYKSLETESEQYYNDILEKWKEMVKEKVLKYRTHYEHVIGEKNQNIETLHEVIANLEKQNANLNNEKENISKKLSDQMLNYDKQRHEIIQALQDEFQDQMVRVEKERDATLQEIEKLKIKMQNLENEKNKEIDEVLTVDLISHVKLETQNKTLTDKNSHLKTTSEKVKDEYSKQVVSIYLDWMVDQVEIKYSIEDKQQIIEQYKQTLDELNGTVNRLTNELTDLQEKHNSLKTEYTNKLKVAEDKISQLKQMLRLERPKGANGGLNSARGNATPDSKNNTSTLATESTADDRSHSEISTQPSVSAQQLEELRQMKDKYKKEIQRWVYEFKKREKRDPDANDKQPIKHLYMKYNALNNQIKAMEENASIQEATGNKENSVLNTEPEDKATRTKSLSPRKAQLNRILNYQNANNVTNMSINASFDGNNISQMNVSHLGTVINDQSYLHGNSFSQPPGLPLGNSNDTVKLVNENKVLREELHQLRMLLANKFEESDAINQLKAEINAIKKDKELLKDKVISLKRGMKVIQNPENSILGGNEELERRSLDTDRYRVRIDTEGKTKEIEAKFNQRLKNMEEDHKRQINELMKAKDSIINRLEQENKTLIEKHNRESKSYSQEFLKLRNQLSELQNENEEFRTLKVHMENRVKTEIAQRKKLHNIIEDMKGKVRVFCRIRPMVSSEINRGCQPIINPIDDFNVTLETRNGPKLFSYDSCFGPSINQEQIFEDTKRLIQSAIDGYNVCIFAYGQTGSGKTYTMHGTAENPGITPRAADELFNLISGMQNYCEINVSCHMVELYMDTLIDLLPQKGQKKPLHLEIKEDLKGMVYIQNVSNHPVNNRDDLLKLIQKGILNRKTSGTAMNDDSSRSHLIVNITIDIHNKHTDQRTIGKLSLVDLAGSEKVNKAQSSTKQLNEARAINKSLTALGDVISALSAQVLDGKDKYVPYRNNKLTMLMKDSLGGTAKTLMFVNVSPADYNQDETQSSLYYASRVKQIVNETVKNIETKELTRMKEYLRQVTEERDKLKLILGQSNIQVNTQRNYSQNTTPNKSDDDSKYDDGPIYRLSINDSFKN